MLGKDYLGYFKFNHKNDNCLFVDREINHSDLTLRPIIDLILEKNQSVYSTVTKQRHQWNG